MSSEHAIAAQLFLYPDAPQAEVTCAGCNGLLGVCEADFANNPFDRQAKAALYPISRRDRRRRGGENRTDIAYHYAKPGHQILYGPDGEATRVFAPEPSELAWCAVGKSMLVFASIFVGSRALHESIDPLRDFVHRGGSSWDAGLRKGPNPKGDRWEDFHAVRADRINDERFALCLDFYNRYSFYVECGVYFCPLSLAQNSPPLPVPWHSTIVSRPIDERSLCTSSVAVADVSNRGHTRR